MTDISVRQTEFLVFVVNCRRDTGMSPSYREVAQHFGVSVASAKDVIDALVRKDYLSKSGRWMARGLLPGPRYAAVFHG